MNRHSDYRFYASLSTPGGEPLGELPLAIDWIPALRWAQFERLRTNVAAPVGADPGQPSIIPEWHDEDGPPFVAGIGIRHPGSEDAMSRLPLEYLYPSVIDASAGLVADGSLRAGQPFGYRIYALAEPGARQTDPSGIEIQALPQAPAIEFSDLSSLLRIAEPGPVPGDENGVVSPRRTDPALRAFLPRALLDEVTRLSDVAGDVETGGILVGKLLRDRGGEIFVRVTAQIAARHTEATQGSLRFTPATWAAADAAIRLRSSNEVTLGWWHRHPHFCKRCPPQRRAHCPLSKPMFSADDRALHREVFQMPWNVALLLSYLGDERPSYDLFTWDRGLIGASRFYILTDPDSNSEFSHE